jgi:amino acid adenylation domain-containing protein
MALDVEMVGLNGPDFYALSPMQQSMLHSSKINVQPGLDTEQLIGELREALDLRAFEKAWQKIIQRHAVLRTAFHWCDSAEPRQKVAPSVPFELDFQNWRGLTRAEQSIRWAAFLQTDRLKGFDLASPPLMRVTVVRTGDNDYRFVWTFHHLLLDAAAFTIVLKELFAFYEAVREGFDLELRAPLPYSGFISWLAGCPQDEAFWRETLNGFQEPTPLAVARTCARKLAEEEQHHGEQCLALTGSEREALQRGLLKSGIPVSTVIEAGWGLLLARYSGQEDVLFGAVRGGRHLAPGAESMVGLCINTLPLRLSFDSSIAVQDWLPEVRRRQLALRPHEHTPLLKILEWSELGAGAPLFESLLNFQKQSWAEQLRAQGNEWANRRFSIRNQPSAPLWADTSAGPDLVLKIGYDRTRLEDDAIARMLEHFKNLVCGLAMYPERKVTDVPWLSSTERHAVVMEWNRTDAEYPHDKTVADLFEEQAARTPEALALKCGACQMNYRELNGRANQLARHLKSLGVGPESIVAVCLERSLDMITAWLAALKSGAAYLPLDPSLPAERLRFMLKDSKAAVLLTQQSLRADLSAPHVISLDAAEQTIRNVHDNARFAWNDNPRRVLNQEQLAYVIYTSGSTGEPKGVALEHRGLVNLVAWHQSVYDVVAEDRASQLAGPGFDAVVWEVWPYLTAGASIHLADEETRLSPDRLLSWLEQQHITLAFLPTPLAEAVMDKPWPETMALRALLTGGDRLHRPPPKTLPCWLTNHYGPTENTVVTTAAVIEPECDPATAPPIGCPIANTKTYILDRYLQPLPVGVPGELHISGIGLARGYLNLPHETASKFISNPFANGEHSRLYKTGDRARFLTNGTIEFLGRIDQQVKIRGNRIELGEIETVLARHPAIQEAVVTAAAGRNGEPKLVAYVVGLPEKSVKASELRRFLRRQLPDCMVPSSILFLDGIPLTRNGKVDRRHLPAAEETPEPDLVAPRNATEEILAHQWGHVLNRSDFGVDQNFFDLGGHSLQATQVISRIRQHFDVDLSIQDLFEAPTIAGMARVLESKGAEPVVRAATATERVQPPNDSGEYRSTPLSFSQERIWFLEQLQPGLPLYNIPTVLDLSGPLDRRVLEESITEIIRRHAPLRMSFTAVNGRPVALEGTVDHFRLPLVDISFLPEEEREAEARRLSQVEAGQPFDLTLRPLIRGKLVRLSEHRHWMLLTFHHLVSDGWSMGVFYRELGTLYEAFLKGEPSPLPAVLLSYSDLAARQREDLNNKRLDSQLDYWIKQLGNELPVLNLPVDRPRPATQTFNGTIEYFNFPAVFTERLNALARQEDVTLFMLLTAGFQTLLHRYTEQDDILIGVPIAGRTSVAAESLIGLFLNTQVLRGDLSGDPGFRELLARVRKTALEAYAHQEVPFEKLVEALHPHRDLSRSPVFQVMFVLQNEPTTPLRIAGVDIKSVPAHNGTAKFDLTFSVEEIDGKLGGYVEYNKDLFYPETIQRMIGHFQTLLEGVVANPECHLSALPLLTGVERNQLLGEWTDTRTPFMSDRCVHAFFEDQVARTPDAVALIFEQEQWTYDELNRRAEAVAAELKVRGVRNEDRVAICAGRSLEMMAGLLGILKAGACYVPLDPTYPRERLQFMLEDSGAAVLLTDASLAAALELRRPGLATLDISLGRSVAAPDPVVEAAGGRNGVGSQQLAYVIYTSGSTGRPKGVMVTHRNVANFFAAMDRLLGTEPGVWLALTSISFDISVLELFWTLARGFKVVIQPEPERVSRNSYFEVTDGRATLTVPQQILRHHVTHVQCTPSLAGTLVSAPESVQAMRSLSKLLLGGEALPSALVQKLRPLVGGEILNMYGPTETTVWSTAGVLSATGGEPLIGKPLANTQVYVLDPRLQPVPLGVPGEVFIGGEGVARGYLQRPELTAERFVPDVFSLRPEARLYRTGDLARFRADGNLEFLGRVDHQVKIRGHRIELGEIETVLGSHPAVAECAVRVWDDGAQDQRLAAYLVVRCEAAEPAPQELRNFLQQHLPDNMIPATFVTLAKLPTTPNGKINRQALPKPEPVRPQLGHYLAPQTELEQIIAAIWRELLHVQEVGLQDNFFDLGGHSLLVIGAQTRLRDALGIDLPIVRLFQYPTISALAGFINDRAARLDGSKDRGRRKQAAYRRVPNREQEQLA